MLARILNDIRMDYINFTEGMEYSFTIDTTKTNLAVLLVKRGNLASILLFTIWDLNPSVIGSDITGVFQITKEAVSPDVTIKSLQAGAKAAILIS